jgi:5'-nucleotidase
MSKILYVNMDSVLVDFDSGTLQLDRHTTKKYAGRLEQGPKIFSLMEPLKDAIESFITLSNHFDVYILSTPPWENLTAASDKFQWVKKYLGQTAHQRLILTHHKNLNIGDYLIDDQTTHGVDKLIGEHIHFGSTKFPNWPSVLNYLLNPHI